MKNRRENKVFLFPDEIIFDAPVNSETVGRLSPADKKRIIAFVGIIHRTEKPTEKQILDFLTFLGLKK